MVRFARVAGMAALALFASLAIAAPAASAPAADGIRLVRERLKIAPVLKGDFEQTKTLKGFRNPLVSKGDFLVARGQGVRWHTRQPYESTLVVTPTRLYTRAADGGTTNLVDADAAPGLRQVNELVFAVLAADLDLLADKFDVVAQPVGATGWTLVLTPRDANIARFMVRATLSGERDVQTVRIEEARGDTTLIRFSHQMPTAMPVEE